MSESEEDYCRLCAEPRPKEQLICTEDEIGLNSNMITKLLWINIDVSNSNTLPNTICFYCFDQLEETYTFLRKVRTAQHKLTTIFLNKSSHEIVNCTIKDKDAIAENVVKPVDEDLELFQVTKREVKDKNQIETVPDSLFKSNVNFMKQEIQCNDETSYLDKFNVIDTEGFNTTDNNLELQALEQTNLHIVRPEKHKLFTISSNKFNHETADCISENKVVITENVAIPVNENCELCQITKNEVEDENQIEIAPEISCINDSDLLKYNVNAVKQEIHCEDNTPLDKCNVIDTESFNTTDSDLSLSLTVEKKKSKEKKKKEDLEQSELRVSTWDDYICHCVECNLQCKNISSLRLHSLQIHSCCCIFKCSDCSMVIPNYISFVNHVRSHKRKLKYCCEFCNKRFDKSASMEKHLTLVHRDAYITMCPNCGLNFETLDELQDHIFTYSKFLKKHDRKQQEIRLDFKCEYCNKEFKSLGSLQQHKLIHTKRSRQFSCDVCSKSFFTKGILGTHMLTHGNTKPYECEYCSKAFRTKGNLRSHIKLHSREKVFVCKQCGKNFNTKQLLESHSIVHMDLKPYVCKYCNEAFHFKNILCIHLRQHKKSYNCVYCQREFINGSNFKKHMMHRHNIDTSKNNDNILNNVLKSNEKINNANQR